MHGLILKHEEGTYHGTGRSLEEKCNVQIGWGLIARSIMWLEGKRCKQRRTHTEWMEGLAYLGEETGFYPECTTQHSPQRSDIILSFPKESTQNFWKGLNRKYWESCGLSDHYSTLTLWLESSHRTYRTTVRGSAPTTLSLQRRGGSHAGPMGHSFQHFGFAAWWTMVRSALI